MAQVKCLYCDAVNDALATGGYCENCGKKLPTSALVKTRKTLLAGDEGPGEGDRASSGRHPASEALLVAAVVYLAAGGLFLILGPVLMRRVPEDFLARVLAWALVPAVLVGGLGGLARWAARPAAALALVGAVAWLAATFALDAGMALPWLLVHAVLLALVGRALWVASRTPAGAARPR